METAPAATLFTAIDAIVAYDGRGFPPGSVGAVHRTLDALRDARTPLASLAEEVSVDMHRLRQALRRRDTAAERQVSAIKARLATSWWRGAGDTTIASVAH